MLVWFGFGLGPKQKVGTQGILWLYAQGSLGLRAPHGLSGMELKKALCKANAFLTSTTISPVPKSTFKKKFTRQERDLSGLEFVLSLQKTRVPSLTPYAPLTNS